MTTNQQSTGPRAAARLAFTGTVIGLTGTVGVVALTAVAVYAFARIATYALVIVGLALGRGSFG